MENNIIKTGKYVPPVPDVSVGKLLLDAMKRNEKRIGHVSEILLLSIFFYYFV